MSQKPSERIKEIAKEIWEPYKQVGSQPKWCTEHAILRYLDEEWEKKQPCNHDEINKKGGICSRCGYGVSFATGN